MRFCLVLAVGLAFVLSASAHAQNIPWRGNALWQAQFDQQPPLGPQLVNIDGAIESLTAGVITVTEKSGKTWKITVPHGAKIEVVGTATAEYLRAGLTVDFKTELDEHGAIKEKIKELTVIAPTTERQMGVFAEADAAGSPDAAAGKPSKRGSAAKGAAAKPTLPTGPCRVVGRLVNNRGKLSVQVHGAPPIELTIADQAAIKLNLTDLSLAADGDHILVKGTMATPMGRGLSGAVRAAQANQALAMANMGVALADEVKITLAEPLTGPKKKMPAKRPKKDVSQPEPAAPK